MELHHYHFVGWPDHGVPGGENVNALKRLIDEVERRKLELKVEIGEDVEVWVHW
jgi:protein-tyrosine phosphatase